MTFTLDAETTIAALRASHDRLVSVAAPLTADQLTQPGYPSEWTVAAVFSHLGSGAQIMQMLLEAGLAGQEPPARDAYQAVWDVWNAKSPREQAADAITADAELVKRLEAVDDEQRATVTFTLFGGPSDVAGLAAVRLGEHAVHTWDIAVAIDPSATILPAAVAVLVDTVGLVVAYSAKPGPWSGRIHVTTTEPAREFALTVGESTSLRPWDSGGADASLALPAEALIRLVYGRLDSLHTPPVTATGVDLDDLRATLRGF